MPRLSHCYIAGIWSQYVTGIFGKYLSPPKAQNWGQRPEKQNFKIKLRSTTGSAYLILLLLPFPFSLPPPNYILKKNMLRVLKFSLSSLGVQHPPTQVHTKQRHESSTLFSLSWEKEAQDTSTSEKMPFHSPGTESSHLILFLWRCKREILFTRLLVWIIQFWGFDQIWRFRWGFRWRFRLFLRRRFLLGCFSFLCWSCLLSKAFFFAGFFLLLSFFQFFLPFFL